MKTLVITPHRPLIPENGAILFSGGWCLNRNIRQLLDERKLEYSVADYPWNDRTRHYNDYLYAVPLYEAFLEVLSRQLNSIHRENYSVDYWRLVAGPALYTVLWHLLDRWRIAEGLVGRDDVDRISLLEFSQFAFTPRLTADVDPDSHDYNHYLIASALLDIGLKNSGAVEIVKAPAPANDHPPSNHATPARGLKQLARASIELASRVLQPGRNNNVFILDSCLPKLHAAILNIALGNFPVNTSAGKLLMPAPSPEVRERMDLQLAGGDRFCAFVAKMLPALLPVYLVEGYPLLAEHWHGKHWPRAPKVIFTSNAFQYNEVFQHYAATKIATTGSKLVVGQHGGVSGILKWCFGADHQTRIADKFLSWGWGTEDKRIVPAFVLTILGRHLRNAKNGCLLLTTAPIRRYSHKGIAWPVGPQQSEAFLSYQLGFARNLNGAASSRVLLRIFENLDRRLETEYVDRWRLNFPDIRIDDSKKSIFAALKATKLFVYTYNSTGYLETLSMNFPTVMFWDTNLFDGKPAFNAMLGELEGVGIFHRTPESAAAHVNRVWDDLDRWWHAPELQRCRARFIKNFANRAPANWLGFMKAQLTA